MKYRPFYYCSANLMKLRDCGRWPALHGAQAPVVEFLARTGRARPLAWIQKPPLVGVAGTWPPGLVPGVSVGGRAGVSFRPGGLCCPIQSGGQRQMGSLAGAAHLLKHNAGVLR